MRKIHIACLILILSISVWAWADVALGSPAPFYITINNIDGFMNCAPTTFYSVTVEITPHYSQAYVHRIGSDTDQVICNFDNSGTTKYISWDPRLDNVPHGAAEAYEMIAPILPKNGRSEGKFLSMPTTGMWGFDEIWCEYTILPAGSDNKEGLDYRLKLKRIGYNGIGYYITATGDFEKLPAYIRSLKEAKPAYRAEYFDNKTARKICVYAQTLPNHTVRYYGNFVWNNSQNSTSNLKQNIITSILQTGKNGVAGLLNRSLSNEYDNKWQRVGYSFQNGWRKYNKRLYWIALLFSIVIEYLVLLIIFGTVTGRKEVDTNLKLEIFLVCAIGTLITLTVNWWIIALIVMPYIISIIVMEAIAILIEALIYKGWFIISFRQAMLLSVTANLVSYTLGVFLLKLIT